MDTHGNVLVVFLIIALLSAGLSTSCVSQWMDDVMMGRGYLWQGGLTGYTPAGFRADPLNIVHIPSSFVFPLELAGFRRSSVVVYDHVGLDVSVGYESDLPVRIDVYVYP